MSRLIIVRDKHRSVQIGRNCVIPHMKVWSSILLLASVCLLPAAPSEELHEVETIYLLPMSGGLDQFLANRLTKGRQFKVVTDPAQADAIFTDRIGAAFEERVAELYPPPPETEADKNAEKKNTAPAEEPLPFVHQAAPARITSFGRGKGNVFLVDRASRHILWSDYKLPRNTQAPELNHIADSIIDRLQRDTKKSAKAAAKKP